MNWHCKSGFNANIQLIKDEFAKARGLKPIKILIFGPPCSGKSFFGQQLGEHYNVPHIHMLKLLDDLKNWDQEKEDDWNKRVADRDRKIKQLTAQRASDSQERERSKQEQRAKADAEKDEEDNEDGENAEGEEKKQPEPVSEAQAEEPINVPLEGDSDDEFQPIEIKEKIKAYIKEHGPEKRIPEDLINEAVRWRLNRNDCQNRGYVLDGYPKDYVNAKNVFIITPKAPEKKAPAEGEEAAEEAPADDVDENQLKPVL